jgi:hypothetical protein
MALFAAIGDRFIAKILKQVASDYNLDYEEMKTRYCGEASFELSVPTKKLVVDLEVPIKVKVPKAVKAPKEPDAPKALSKMKKPDLVRECEERDLDSEGTVAQLKDRIKEAREAEAGVSPAKPVKKAPTKKKEAKKTKSPPPPVVLEEEPEEEEPDSPGGVRARQLRDREEEEEFEDEPEDDLQARLRKILAEAEEEEFDEEDDEVV